MASILRSLRPVRNEIKKSLTEKPALIMTFTSDQERDHYLMNTELFINTLRARRNTFFQLHEKLIIIPCTTEADQKAIDEVVDADATLLLELDATIEQYGVRLNRLNGDRERNLRNPVPQHNEPQHEPQQLPGSSSVKLPRIDLKKFSGDVMQWQEFWDSFESAVHNNNSLSAVDKFNYLKGQLVGEAKATVTGLSLTNENYLQAVNILKQRFGGQQIIVNAHYMALSALQSASDQTSQIRLVLDTLEKHLRSLESLGEDVDHSHFVSMIFSKLPREFIMRLEENRGDAAWTVPLLRKRAQKLLEARELAEQHYKPSAISQKPLMKSEQQKKTGKPHTTTGSLLTNSGAKSGPSRQCFYCQGNHWADECPTHTTVEARKRQIKGKCFVCIRDGHSQKTCKSEKACFYCKQKKLHHRSLCPKKFPVHSPKKDTACSVFDKQSQDSVITKPNAESALVNLDGRGLLQTACIYVKDPASQQEVQIRLVLDSGSQRTYVTEDLVTKLKAKAQSEETLAIYTFGSSKATQIDTKVVKLQLKLLDGSMMEIFAHTVPKIGEIHHKSVDVSKLSTLYKNLPLADPVGKDPPKRCISLLIGNNYYWDLITAERIELAKGLYLIGSKLGWVVSGRYGDASFWANKPSAVMLTPVANSLITQSPYGEVDQPLLNEVRLEDWWSLETVGIKDPPQDTVDDTALKQFNKSIQYKDQRYMVTWPWKDNVDHLPNNYNLALGRLNSLMRRFKSDGNLLEKYDAIMQMQLQIGIIEKAPEMDNSVTKKHYIPHHPIITPDKTTTKVRIVYDGSAKSRKDLPSINECLHRGPVILEDICSLLIRFRMNKIALTADIEKAFLQIGLQPAARDVTRFLWLKDTSKLDTKDNIQVFRFTRVPFGIISSPFLLGATIKYHLLKDGSDFAKNLIQDLYVDNLISGTSSSTLGIKFYHEAKALFQSASMNLREWVSNDPKVMEAIPKDDKVVAKSIKVLGMIWNIDSDTLQLARSMNSLNLFEITKRTILQEIAKFFDPLGLYGPVLVPAKIFLQTLWLNKNGWDDPLISSQIDEWSNIIEPLEQIKAITVPRYIGLASNNEQQTNYELHCFTDASMKAYGAAVYLRVHSFNNTSVHLLFSKSRLAPTRAAITVPRLELLAASIGGNMLQFVEKSLHVNVTDRILWTDSQCVLHWIRSCKPLSTFVSNRVKKLHELAHVHFRYVETDQNPADLVSRGCSVVELNNNLLWWHGPLWLSQDKSEWPPELDQFHQLNSTTLKEISSEQKPHVLFETSMITSDLPSALPPSPFGIVPSRFSSLPKLLRITAWCLRFVNKLKGKTNPNERSLNATELQLAQQLWIKHVQATDFSDVFNAIAKGKRIPLQDHLNLWLDDNGILRCKGRLTNANLEMDAICPILLPKKNWFTTLIIRSYHEKLLHSGTAHTLSQIRHTFWIPSGRSIVHQYVKSCLKCKCVEGGPYAPPSMPAFPKSRVQKSAPFTWTGLDYLGPIYVKRDQVTAKSWICLFTCMATRAVHLELVEDLSADQFLLCLRRFISRRGSPSHILSDNATQFKLAKSTIEELWTKAIRNDKVLSYISSLGIKWTFIPERAPWMGGIYERLVQLVKRALRKSLQNLCLTYVQFQTVLTEVEAMLNSRPLVHVGSDFQDGQTLTPAHFLMQNPKIGVPDVQMDNADPDYCDQLTSKVALLQRWKKGEQHLQTFWKHWHNDYLLSLRERVQPQLHGCRGAVNQLPKIGDIVHIRQESPRGMWPLAKIIKLLPSSDGKIRAAKVQSSTGSILTRAILHLYPLEIHKDKNENDCPSDESKPLVFKDQTQMPVSASKLQRPQRQAAVAAKQKIHDIAHDTEEEDVNFISIHSHSSFPSITFFLMNCFLMLLLSTTTAQPMLCEKGSAKLMIDLGQVQKCTFDQTQKIDKVYWTTIQIYKRNIAKHESPAHKCSKVITSSQAWTNFAKAGFDHRTTEELITVSESDCKAMVRDRRCSDGPLLGGELASFTENKVDPPYSTGNAWDCCQWITAKTTNCFLLKGKVYQTFQGHMESNLGNVIDCSYEKESCTLPDRSMLIWTQNKNATCEYVLWKTVDGQMWNNQFLSNDLEIALTWNQVQQTVTTCNGTLAKLTDQGIPMVITKTRLLTNNIESLRPKREIEASDAVAMRLQALEIRLDSLFTKSLNHAFSTVCQRIQELQEIDLVLAHSEPILIARRLLNDSQIMARLYGQILEVWPCHPVDQFEYLQMNTKCFEWIPINFTIRGTTSLGYLDPKTFIIYTNSAPVDCDMVQEIYFLDTSQGLLIYTAHNGVVRPFKGQLVKHALHSAKMMEFVDFATVIHKPIQLYTQNELRAQNSLNDLFASFDSHTEILRQLTQVASDSPKNKETQAIIDTVSRNTPWGLISSWANQILWIWIYSCCTLVTLQFFGSRILQCIQKRQQTHIRVIKQVPSASSGILSGLNTSQHKMVTLADIVKETTQEI